MLPCRSVPMAPNVEASAGRQFRKVEGRNVMWSRHGLDMAATRFHLALARAE